MSGAFNRIGYFCSLVPMEIITAAGLKPVRVNGRTEQTAEADAYLYPNLCPYIKSLFSDARDGGLPGCDGVVFTRSCDGMRRLYDAWKAYIPSDFTYMLEAPKNCDDLAIEYFSSQLRIFARKLGENTGAEITERDLAESVKAANRLRHMMQGFYARQKESPLPVRGSQVFKLGIEILSGNDTDSADKLKSEYEKASKCAGTAGGRKQPRLLVSGNVMDRPGLFEVIEAAGAEVPFADLCTASRFFERTVDEDTPDIYRALAVAYLGEPRCSRAATPDEIYARLSKKVKEYAIDGVLLTSLKYCDQVLNDVPYLVRRLSGAGTPALFVENDYLFSDIGRLRTRVEAFIETLVS